MPVDLQRRALFRTARLQPSNSDIHLPWLKSLDNFLDKCTRCSACLEHCPEQIIEQGDGGYPTVNFTKGECTFCGDCASHCPENLFDVDMAVPWALDLTITADCFTQRGIVCQSCRDACDAKAISFRHMGSAIAKPVVDASSCTSCGSCVSACPANAITLTPETESTERECCE